MRSTPGQSAMGAPSQVVEAEGAATVQLAAMPITGAQSRQAGGPRSTIRHDHEQRR